jgi:hypothetical protein
MINGEYIFTRTNETVEGFRYTQPVERVNGKKYYDYPEDSEVRKIWADLYWENWKNRSALNICRFDNPLWNESIKDEIYKKVRAYEDDPRRGGCSTTEFFDFEIWLMSNGWELWMGGMNANGGGRSYFKDGVWVSTEYGSTCNGEEYKFAVGCSKKGGLKHMPKDNFEDFIKWFG